MGRPFDKHIDEQELEALSSPYAYESDREDSVCAASVCEAERHLAFCADCRRRVSQYRRLVNRMNVDSSAAGAPQPDCPTDIDWHDVAAGLWPELKAQQLITHAARCAHCGPLLRAAASDNPTPREEEFLAQLKAPVRPAMRPTQVPDLPNQSSSNWRQLWNWKVLVPAGAMLLILASVSAGRFSSSPLSGSEFAQFAANTHEERLNGKLALQLETGSQTRLNEWLHEESQFALALPSSSEVPREQIPYRIEGARLIGIRNKSAVYISYQMQTDPVSLIVAPVSVAVASGGVEAAFKKVNFHYYTVQGSKVVTWSVHGLTYALVSHEGNRTQRSCMVCHSTMRDRDLSNTPTPLADQKTIGTTYLQ